MSGDAPAAAVWFLSLVIAQGEIAEDGPFTEAECRRCGDAWLAALIDLSKRTKRPRPRGFLCMPAVSAAEVELRAERLGRPRRCDLSEAPILQRGLER